MKERPRKIKAQKSLPDETDKGTYAAERIAGADAHSFRKQALKQRSVGVCDRKASN